MINFTKIIDFTLRYFSKILLKSFRGLSLHNTSLYICSICSKQVVHGLFKIIKIMLTTRSIINSFRFPNHVFLQTMFTITLMLVSHILANIVVASFRRNTSGVENLKRKRSFQQYEVNTFQSIGINECDGARF